MTVMLKDQGTPVRSSVTTASVRINVNRNINCPQFSSNSPSSYTIKQSQTTAVFATVDATDNDAPVSFISWGI
jgi:hypothetical protein